MREGKHKYTPSHSVSSPLPPPLLPSFLFSSFPASRLPTPRIVLFFFGPYSLLSPAFQKSF